MKWMLGRRPSPAMVVALIALFVALGGVSYGFATGEIDSREIKNNDIRSIDLRNNQIRTRDLRNNEVRGIDIRNSTIQSRDIAINAVRGDDVKEDTLAQVPSALLADSATRASSADNATSVSSLKIIPLTTVADGADPVVLATHGPLTLSGACVTGTIANLTISTTEDHTQATGTDSGIQSPSATRTASGAQVLELDAGAPPEEIARLEAGMGIRGYTVTTVSAFAPSGKGFTGDIAMFRDQSGDDVCRFHGSLALQG